jgi:hypothetical protein
VNTQWGQVDGHDGTAALFLKFIRPMELFMVLEFDIAKKGFMVDQILTASTLRQKSGLSFQAAYRKTLLRFS